MKMPPNIAAWFQGNLYLLTLSGYSADLFICAKPGNLTTIKVSLAVGCGHGLPWRQVRLDGCLGRGKQGSRNNGLLT
jgi:hypothetical protein